MAKMTKKSFDEPDDSMQPAANVKADEVEIGGVTVKRVTVDAGWRWSKDLKPVQKTDSCQTDHLLYLVFGKLSTKMNDGEEQEFGPGDMAHIPPGHDGWADERTVWLELPH